MTPIRLYMALVLIVFGSLSAAAEDGVAVRALVDRNQIEPGESLRLRVVVRGGDGVVDLAPLTDFEIHSRGTATQISMINMKTTREVTHTYQLIPRKTGTLTIPALTVDVDGRRLTTAPIQITVAASAKTPGHSRDIFVEVDVSHQQVYVGQQMRYTFTLYQGVQITEARLEQPDFKGFETHEFEERPSRRKVMAGREYVITEVSYLLIPLTAGEMTISPARLSFGLVKRQQRRRSNRLDDFFNDSFFGLGRTQVEPRLLASDALQVTVRPLPDYAGELPFSGLVGQFELHREVAQTALKVGESTTVAVHIRGRGNIRDAQAPALVVPPAFKTYADTPTTEIQLRPGGFQGEKVFRTALVPVTIGSFPLPPSRLVYFDPIQEQYREIRSDAIELAVTAGDPGTDTTVAVMAAPGAGQVSGRQQQRVDFTGKDLLPLKEGLDALEPSRHLGQTLFWILLLLPALAYLSLGGVLRLFKPAMDARSRMRREARLALKEASKTGPDAEARAFLNALRRALVAAVMGATGGSGAALTAEEARQRLAEHGRDTAAEAGRLLEEIDTVHYSGAPLTPEAREGLRRRTSALVRKVLK